MLSEQDGVIRSAWNLRELHRILVIPPLQDAKAIPLAPCENPAIGRRVEPARISEACVFHAPWKGPATSHESICRWITTRCPSRRRRPAAEYATPGRMNKTDDLQSTLRLQRSTCTGPCGPDQSCARKQVNPCRTALRKFTIATRTKGQRIRINARSSGSAESFRKESALKFIRSTIRLGVLGMLVAAVSGCCVYPPYGRVRGGYGAAERYDGHSQAAYGAYRGEQYSRNGQGERWR